MRRGGPPGGGGLGSSTSGAVSAKCSDIVNEVHWSFCGLLPSPIPEPSGKGALERRRAALPSARKAGLKPHQDLGAKTWGPHSRAGLWDQTPGEVATVTPWRARRLAERRGGARKALPRDPRLPVCACRGSRAGLPAWAASRTCCSRSCCLCR